MSTVHALRTTTRAAAGTAAFFIVAPGVVTGVVPWWLTRWEVGGPGTLSSFGSGIGAATIIIGITVLVGAFARFVREGRGTPAPVAPTESLVIGGLYRYVRNPMYLAVVSIILGQALVLQRPVLLTYAALVWGLVATFVHGYEEPALRRRFGETYKSYCRAVPAWWPRPRPWSPEQRLPD